jgi:mannose/cellobiose epimerase-like protein (N-acyl-D-glucosamine 2-epimerase family)
MTLESLPDWLTDEPFRLLRFAEGARDPAGGFGRQHLHGGLTGGPVELWVTGRMTHVFALGELLGYPGADRFVEHGLAALSPGAGRLADATSGGWYSAVGPDRVDDDRKAFYQHCFVLLGAASALTAGHPTAARVLDEAREITLSRFWDDEAGLPRESWDAGWARTEDYRGVNATMHGVEAFLAVYDVTGDPAWRDRALRMTSRVLGWARDTGWRIPEHFDPEWNPLPDYNRDAPADPFRPYGSTVGHSLEWARLCCHLNVVLGPDAPAWLVEGAEALFARAVADGWAVDGADGFVYTVDWDGVPVVHERMSWVAAEAVAAATVLHQVTGSDPYRSSAARWWEWIGAHLVDPDGAWRPELGRDLRPSGTVWSDQPEVYHAVQAALFARELPLRGSIAASVADRART